jgi:5'-methylthioadenosine phosphorylase
VSTFFEELTVHVALADPVCAVVANALHQAAAATGATVHFGGTYLCMEGPQFSTRAESRLYRQWGVDVIGMTNMPEAKLAREAELCYATLALATDYDCWHVSAADVDIGAILAILQHNVQLAQEVITRTVPQLQGTRTCPCSTALQTAIITDRAMIPTAVRERLELLIDRYLTA